MTRDRLLILLGRTYKRNDTGRTVRVMEIRPCGDRVFCLVQDCDEDGLTTVVEDRELRPITPRKATS